MTNANETGAKAEACMMGIAVKVTDDKQAKGAINYMIKTLFPESEVTADTIFDGAYQFVNKSDNPRVTHLSLNRTADFTMLALAIDTDEEQNVIDSEDGAFCYVYNFEEPMFSELGYSFFQRDQIGFLHRIG